MKDPEIQKIKVGRDVYKDFVGHVAFMPSGILLMHWQHIVFINSPPLL